jgi:hypothetical protein
MKALGYGRTGGISESGFAFRSLSPADGQGLAVFLKLCSLLQPLLSRSVFLFPALVVALLPHFHWILHL